MSYQNQSSYIQEHIHRRFNVLKKVGSGAYGHVWKVEQKHTKKIFALKKIFDAFQHATDAQRTYREIEILRQIDHINIIKLFDTIKADNNRDVYLIFEFVEADLHNVVAEGILKDIHIRYIIYQIAKGLKYLHSGKIIHRDLKPSNILVNSNCSIKICDFGLVRSLASNKDQGAVLTEGVATRWYRAPEVLLGSKSYSKPADIWSFGCIIYEVLAQKPLFNGSSTLDQVEKVCSFTGYPSEEDIQSLESDVAHSFLKEMKISAHTKPSLILKDLEPMYVDLLERMLVFNPSKRVTVDEILSHELVKTFRKKEEEISCKKEICTPIDDNKKYSVQQYRKLIYGNKYVENPKPKQLSSSLGANSTSPKYLQTLNKTATGFTATKPDHHKIQLQKKLSYDKMKSMSHNISDETLKKMAEKQNIRYIKSLNNLYKGQNGYIQANQIKKEPSYMTNVNNHEQLDSPTPSKQISSPMLSQNINYSPKISLQQKNYGQFNKYNPSSTPVSTNNSFNNSSNSQPNQTNLNWKNKPNHGQTVLSNIQIKQKVLQFRSPKNVNTGKPMCFLGKSSQLLPEISSKKAF